MAENIRENKEFKEMLVRLYHLIDMECISETDTVKMESIRKIFAEYGADIKRMDG